MSAPRVAIRPEESCKQLAWTLSYEREGELPVYIDGLPNALHRLRCKDARTPDRVARMAYTLDLHENKEVAIGLPRVAEFVYRSTVLWAWVVGGDQEARAGRFRPLPNIVLKVGSVGSERLLIWVLREPINGSDAERFNARISYALHGARTRSKPEALRVPMPGTFMRVDRRKPAPILVTRWEPETGMLEAGAIGNRLREPPSPDAWRERRT